MNEHTQGYYRYPTIHDDRIAFIAEDDLWSVKREGGIAQRITANQGQVSHPIFSPDGKWIAFTGREEGHLEVYVMSSCGGAAKRLTFLGSVSVVVNWHDEHIVFATNYGQPFGRTLELWGVDLEGSFPQQFPFGHARSISTSPQGGVVIGRNTGDPARWKRYRGGTAGELWVDPEGKGAFRKLIDLEGDLADPMWIGERIYFLSDHDGIGNVYSCLPDGSDLQPHTSHRDFYARNASTDGKRIVYHCGADVYVYDVTAQNASHVNIAYYSPYIQRSRKFVSASAYLEDASIAPDGSHISVISRGKAFTMGNWEGAVRQHGVRNGVRYQLAQVLDEDNNKVIMVSDEPSDGNDTGGYHLEIHRMDDPEKVEQFLEWDLGIPYQVKVSPKKPQLALTNHRHELIWIDYENREMNVLDRSEYSPIAGFDWSPDGRWIAYSTSFDRRTVGINIYSLEHEERHSVTQPVRFDVSPVFDPEGKYLYFLSWRIFNPVYDGMHFDLGFPEGMKPYLITLRKDVESPFVPKPHGFEDKKKEKDKEKDKDDEKDEEQGHEEDEEQDQEETEQEDEQKEKEDTGKKDDDDGDDDEDEKDKALEIDFEGIEERVLGFPVSEGKYSGLAAIKEHVFYSTSPVEGALGTSWRDDDDDDGATLRVYNLKEREEETVLSGVSSFTLSADKSAMLLRMGGSLRVIKTPKGKESSSDSGPGRKSGWIDLSRVKVSIDPLSEWQQMFREAWRLQREYFWVEDMADVNWRKVFDRYYPLVERVASRSEFSDLIWEMQGELGTSHAYELGGDYRPGPQYRIGFLGADMEYDAEHDAYRFIRIVTGDVWDDEYEPPLKRPGLNLKEGMILLAVNGENVSKTVQPYELLVYQVGEEVELTVAEADGSEPRRVTVKTVGRETLLRYRDWVEKNRTYVHDTTNGKVGYIHIPNMGAWGYAEFHRYFLVELEYDGVIVDVRFNGGGHVSPLILEKLARKRIGYDFSRWMGYIPYPEDSVAGSLVALTNEHAGSDGDIFSHAFKLMKLGKLIGRRTWGGVIGIWPRNWLVDGTLTTQPEFSFWFQDVGWAVENYGTDPDIEVDITPQEYAAGRDPQLDKAIDVILREIEQNPPLKPDFSTRPKRTLPEE